MTTQIDGGWVRNPNHQLIGVKHPIIYRVSTIQGGAGLLPPTVWEFPKSGRIPSPHHYAIGSHHGLQDRFFQPHQRRKAIWCP